MESRRYNEKSLGKGCGISRSLLMNTATKPRKKNKTGGLSKLFKINSDCIEQKWVKFFLPVVIVTSFHKVDFILTLKTIIDSKLTHI